MGKIKHPKSIGKVPPPSTYDNIPLTRKKTIHRQVQVERPKPFRRLPKTKEMTAALRPFRGLMERIDDLRQGKSHRLRAQQKL